MKERVVVLPGYGSRLDLPVYCGLHELAQQNYQEVIEVDVPWDEGNITDWFDAARKQVPKGKSDVIAYSCGALLALQLGADERTVDVEIDRATFLSVSCWGGNPQSMQVAERDGIFFTPEQIAAFEKLPVGWMARMFRARSVDLLCGESELFEMIRRSQDVQQLMGVEATLTMIPGARHADMLKKPVLRVVERQWKESDQKSR
ncbi:MAG TPA: hypothetical protein VF733_03135 [Candidatus Saccharimonadales bacterium]